MSGARLVVVFAAVACAILPASNAAGQELATFWGKGTSSNPNADMSYYAVSWDSGRIASARTRTHIITGEVYGESGSQLIDLGAATGPTVVGGGARPFKFAGIGKSATLAYRSTFCTLGGGAALFARTADKTQYGVAPYYEIACGVTVKGYTIALGRFAAGRPGLNDPWTGRDYDAPVFQGLRVGFEFDRVVRKRS